MAQSPYDALPTPCWWQLARWRHVLRVKAEAAGDATSWMSALVPSISENPRDAVECGEVSRAGPADAAARGHRAVARRTASYAGMLLAPAQWLVHEFLTPGSSRDGHAVLTTGARLVGCSAICGILRVELGRGLPAGVIPAVAYMALAGVTAVMLGNLAKEMAFTMCEALVTALGRVFSRRGCSLTGRRFHELHFPDGTWVRHEQQRQRIVCEWTDRLGRCHRVAIEPKPLASGDGSTRASR